MPGFRKTLADKCRDLGHEWITGFDKKGPTGNMVCRRCHVQRQQTFACHECTAEFLSPKALGHHQRAMNHHGEILPTTVGMDREDCEIAAETVADLTALLEELECPPNP